MIESNLATTIIVHKLKPGRKKSYEVWAKNILSAAQTFKGHRSGTILRNQPLPSSEYIVILQFDTEIHLQKWFNSEIRRKWLERAKPLIDTPFAVNVLTGIETWFTLPNESNRQLPARYKVAILTSVSVFVLVNFYNWLISLVLPELPSFINSLIVVVLVVFSLTYVVMPRLTRLFNSWLFH